MANLQFVFQGSQKKDVRVPISQKASEVGFKFPTKIVGKMVVYITVLPDFLGI